MNNTIFDDVYEVIKSRKSAESSESYVASLYKGGREKIAQKVGEEAVELVVEAVKDDTEKMKEESADLLFHMMILWADASITPQDIQKVLEGRFGTSGHTEKQCRANKG